MCKITYQTGSKERRECLDKHESLRITILLVETWEGSVTEEIHVREHWKKRKNQLWEGKRSQKGHRKKKVREPSVGALKCYKKWATHDHESVNHPVVACRGTALLLCFWFAMTKSRGGCRHAWCRPTIGSDNSVYSFGGGGSAVTQEFVLVFVARRRHLLSRSGGGLARALSFHQYILTVALKRIFLLGRWGRLSPNRSKRRVCLLLTVVEWFKLG